VLLRAVALRQESLLEVDLQGGTTENRSDHLDFYFSFKALYATIQSKDELRACFANRY
jgi:hypothetical protein